MTSDTLVAADRVREQTTDGNATDDQQTPTLSTADMASAAQNRPTTDSQAQAQPADADAANTEADGNAPLFSTEDAGSLRSRWSEIQTGFVDDPRNAVEQADSLVAETMQQLAKMFADERSNLESQWDKGDDISTEDLRLALQRYRSFFDRLLAV